MTSAPTEKQRMDIAREISSLNRNDLIISHNARMTEWLRTNGLTTQVVDLDIFDYHCDSKGNNTTPRAEGDPYRLVFAGVLERRKNDFLYQLDDLGAKSYLCNLYGIGFDPADLPSKSLIHYRGVFPADEIVDRIEGDFGIVWDGISVEECAGSFGEYLKINNPHKTSMYLRAGLPVIIWDQAAHGHSGDPAQCRHCSLLPGAAGPGARKNSARRPMSKCATTPRRCRKSWGLAHSSLPLLILPWGT